MALDLAILYRGELASCNYACAYCPFAKRHDDREALARDAAALARFVDWIDARKEDRFAVFFTPWGEALIRASYRNALVRLSVSARVWRVAAQTNLSMDLTFLSEADREKVALWCTYHPTQVGRGRFLEQCAELERLGVRYSVGVVGLREQIPEIERLRGALPSHVYLWVNALKRDPGYYRETELRRLAAVDPLFFVNAVRHESLGHVCRAGERVVSVDGAGTVRRCHFIEQPIGNLYESGFEASLRERACTNESCGCHIGYVHLERLGLEAVFGRGLLERIARREALEPLAVQRTLRGLPVLPTA